MLFFRSYFAQLNLLVDIAGVVIFSLFIAVDFQRAKYASKQDVVWVTLAIFLDFVNLLTFILDIILSSDD